MTDLRKFFQLASILFAGALFSFSGSVLAQDKSDAEGEKGEKVEAPVAAEKAEPAKVVEEDDDWDKAGPVDKKPRISGALMGSFRYTYLTEDALPDGTAVDDFNTFQIEHTHIKFSGDLSEKLSWEIIPCVTHMNDFSVLTANFTYEFRPELQVTFGRFLLPFGQFNLRSLPGTYTTVSRPLLYLSHEDRPVVFEGTPPTFLFTPRDDTGVLFSGSFWLGPDDIFQLSYNAYVTNGLRATSDQMARFWDDNNKWKQLGGRLSLGYNGDPFTLTGGGSYLKNRYEDDLDQYAWSGDIVAAYQYQTGRRITLRGEYVNMEREIQPTAALLSGDEGLRGAYVTLEGDVTDKFSTYYQFDTIRKRTPQAQANQTATDLSATVNRHAIGIVYLLDGGLQLKGEYSYWLQPLGLPNAHRISIQTVVTF